MSTITYPTRTGVSDSVVVPYRPTSSSGGDSGNITDIMVNLNAGNGGLISLAEGNFSIPTAITLLDGVSITGVPFNINSSSNITTRGTRLFTPNGLEECFKLNSTDLGGQPTANAMQAARITGSNLSNISFDGFTYALRIGAKFNVGTFFCQYRNLYALNCSQWSFYFENCSISEYNYLNVLTMATGSIGAVYFGASTTAYNHGNSRYQNIFVQPGVARTRNIVFQAREGATFNDLEAFKLQANTGSAGKISQAATMANTSTDITVVDGTEYPLDMPVTVSANANGFVQHHSYFVIFNSGNVVRVAEKMRGTAIAATGNTAVNLDTYGYPALEIVAYQDVAGTKIQPSTFTGIDCEGFATCVILVQNATIDIRAGTTTSSGQGTFLASTFCTRDMIGTWAVNSTISCDLNTSNKLVCMGTQLSEIDALNCVQAVPIGLFYDRLDSAMKLNLGSLTNGNKGMLKAVNAHSTSFFYPYTGMGQRVSASSNVALSMLGINLSADTFIGASDGVWTLPTLVTGVGGTGSAGITAEISNSTLFKLTLNTSGGDTYNQVAGWTSIVIPPKSSVFVRAHFDGTNKFWAVVSDETLAKWFLSKTANYTILPADEIIYVDATGGNVTITLPLANIVGTIKTKRFSIKRTDASANVVTINTQGTDTIETAASVTLGVMAAKEFISNGVNPAGDWRIV